MQQALEKIKEKKSPQKKKNNTVRDLTAAISFSILNPTLYRNSAGGNKAFTVK